MRWEAEPPPQECPEEELPENGPILGARASGRTQALITIAKEAQLPSLAIISWPWERARWAAAKIPNLAIHTPDSLARLLFSRWESKRKKTLNWRGETLEEAARDADDYARGLLNRGEMTIGAAHWLLKEEIEEFQRRGLLPKKPELLLMDDIDQWEPEALEWCQRLPHTIKRESQKEEKGKNIQGTLRPGEVRRPYRMLRANLTPEKPGEWAVRTINSLSPQHLPVALIAQTDKAKWAAYLSPRTHLPVEVLHCEETQGRTWSTILLPNLYKNWGSPSQALDWLDLAASRAEKACIARINPQEAPNWLPSPRENQEILVWSI